METIEAIVNGTLRNIVYSSSVPVSERKLRILSESGSTIQELPFLNIIGFDSRAAILYTEDNPAAKDDRTVSPFILRALPISHVPSSIQKDLQPPKDSLLTRWLIPGAPMVAARIHIIVSTGSGTGAAKSTWDLLLKPLLDRVGLAEESSYNVHFTTSVASIGQIAHEIILPAANQGQPQAIILLSGDGGLVDIINALLLEQHGPSYRPPDVALMPLGTGNALAHSSGVTGDNTLGLRSMWIGSPKNVPVFCARFSPGARFLFNEARDEVELPTINGAATAYGAVVCSWAFHAGLVADSDTAEYRKYGAERFKMAANQALYPEDGAPPHPYSGKVSILRPGQTEWQSIDRETHGYVLATFCSYLEKGFQISPDSKPLDTQLRLVHFGPLSGDEAMNAMGKAYAGGQHVHDEKINYEAIDGLRIEFQEDDARWRRVCIDGKIVRVEAGGWMEMKSIAARIVDLIVRE